jgi:hypothetical protein
MLHQDDPKIGLVLVHKRKRQGGPSAGEPSSKRIAAGCNTCGKEHPGICWLIITCDYCKRKGYPTGWCYDNPESPDYKGKGGQRQGSILAHVAVRAGEKDSSDEETRDRDEISRGYKES